MNWCYKAVLSERVIIIRPCEKERLTEVVGILYSHEGGCVNALEGKEDRNKIALMQMSATSLKDKILRNDMISFWVGV
jgi:hypothetical protein